LGETCVNFLGKTEVKCTIYIEGRETVLSEYFETAKQSRKNY